MTDNLTSKSAMQANSPDPIVENPNLPSMDDALRESSAEPRGAKLLDETANLMAPVSNSDSANLMAPFTPGQSGSLMAPVSETVGTEQQAGRNVTQDLQPKEKYVRLRLQVENGAISVIGASAVAGPLVMEEQLHGPLVYEVSSNQIQLAIGSIPDLGIWRSFPHPQPVPGQEGHHITAISSGEFTVRIPQEQLAAVALSDVQVTVHRVRIRPEITYRIVNSVCGCIS